MAEAFRERVVRTDDAKEGPQAFMEKRDPSWTVPMTTDGFETIRYEVGDDHVATITLEPARGAQRLRPRRCARRCATPGSRSRTTRRSTPWCCGPPATGRSAPASTRSKSYGQPDDVWNHEDPGELLSPKWQQVLEAGGVRGAGHLHRRRLLLRQRGRHRHLLARRDLLRLARHLRAGLRPRAGRPHAQGRAWPRRCAWRCRATTSGSPPRPRCGSASSPRSSTREELWARAHEIAAGIARKPSVGDPGHGARDLGVARPALPRRHGAGPHLHPGRQPDRRWPRWPRSGARPSEAEAPLMTEPTAARSAGSIAEVLAIDPSAPALEFERPLAHVGRARRDGRRGRQPLVEPGERVGVLLRNRPAQVGAAARRAARRRLRRHDQPRPRRRPGAGRPRGARRRHRRRRAGRPARRWPRRSAGWPATQLGELRRRNWRDRRVACDPPARRRRPGVAVRMLTSGTTGPPEAGAAHLRDPRAGARRRQALRAQPERRRCGCAPGVAIVNSPLVHLGGLFRVLQCVNDGRSFCLLERFTRRRLGRRRAPPPPRDRQPRARRAAHGARGRPRPGRPREPPLGGLRHRAARPRRRRRLPRAVRRARAHLLRGHRVRRRRRRVEPRRPRAVLGGQAGERRPGPPGLRAAGRRRRDGRRRSGPTRRACSR